MGIFYSAARALVLIACVAAALYATWQLESLRQEYSTYSDALGNFAATEAIVADKSYFTVQGDQLYPTRYVRLTYVYTAGERRWTSTCISFRNCAGIELVEIPTLLGRDVAAVVIGDRITVQVARSSSGISYLYLESKDSALLLVYMAAALWCAVLLVSALASLVAWTQIRSKATFKE
jgi:hypothetical protein